MASLEDGGAGCLGAAEFAGLMEPVLAARPSGIVVAVSGGPDSVCLMHRMAAWARDATRPPIWVATVDHGLRPDSPETAAAVLCAATAAGLPASVLRWETPKPRAAVQEAARDARYALLSAFCADHRADHLLTGHTLDDQAETVLFRLTRGSGPAGLAGMHRQSRRGAVVHSRPLLGIAKARLVATCRAEGWPFVEDPANADPRFARTRMRHLLPLLAAEDLDAKSLARLAVRAGRADAALQHAAGEALRRTIRIDGPGHRRFDALAWEALPAEIVIRMLGVTLADLGHARPVRLEGLERLAAALCDALARRSLFARTFHGTVLRLSVEGRLDVVPEGPRRRGLTASAAAMREFTP